MRAFMGGRPRTTRTRDPRTSSGGRPRQGRSGRRVSDFGWTTRSNSALRL